MMRLLAAAALLCSASAAHASYLCGSPNQIVGANGTNPVVSTEFGIDATSKQWWVNHKLADGTLIRRGEQYDMNQFTNKDRFGWQGQLHRNRDLWMFGEVSSRNGGYDDVWYTETIYDHGHGDAVVMRSQATCTVERPQQSAPVVASGPAAVPLSGGSSLPLMFKGASAYASISLGTMPVIALIDTGSTGMTVTQKIADWLVSNGQATTTVSQQMVLADGSKQEFNHIVISSVTIAGHELRNIEASIMPDSADILLGLSVLNQVSTKFVVDTANARLVFN